MKPNLTVTFDSEIQPQIESRPGMKFICRACCALSQLRPAIGGGVVTWCPAGHPQIMVSADGKVMGTSA